MFNSKAIQNCQSKNWFELANDVTVHTHEKKNFIKSKTSNIRRKSNQKNLYEKFNLKWKPKTSPFRSHEQFEQTLITLRFSGLSLSDVSDWKDVSLESLPESEKNTN